MSDELVKDCMKEELQAYNYEIHTLDKDVTQDALKALINEHRNARRNMMVMCRIYIPPTWESRVEQKLKNPDV